MTDRAREFRGLTLLELARHALDQRGIATRGMSKMELATEALIGRSGLHSTSDFPLILANVANKTLRAAYDTTPRTFTAWARQAVITDFKPVARNQLGGAPDLLRVPESGEFTYGTIGESREVYALVTYGRIVGITRQTLINDDLDAFTRIPSAFGAAAADLESDLVYSIFSTNPNMADGNPLFHASHANLGTAGAISETTLAEAYRLFGNQRGLEGRQISVLPRYIITPPGVRSVEARKNVTATTPNAVAGVNAFANRLEPIEEARLIPAAGPDPWFLAADPSRIDTIEFAYLEGQQGVYTETRSGFEVDGIEIKARHDFAAKAIDWRGLFRNAGV
ncbi:phage major capsid protein [Rhodobacter capsulatus]